MNRQPEALELASHFENWVIAFAENQRGSRARAAKELRRLHARVQKLEAVLDAVCAGGVSAQRVTQKAAPVVPPEPLCWVNEDELPESMSQEAYTALFPYSKVDTVRLFPIFAAPQPQADGRDAAWSDLKIAFDIPDGEDETLWKCVESGAITLPNGWKLIETTGAGGVGPVAVFRTEHLPTSSETFVVGSAINYAIAASKENK